MTVSRRDVLTIVVGLSLVVIVNDCDCDCETAETQSRELSRDAFSPLSSGELIE